ncbi:hypothetical protein AB0A81_39890 [Streptomyces flaveolus]|uniref:Uncharacterized protein n=1 Tax=Streptomyces flaveolus TaxID=67297 RepID=A0ABV1VID2_9ACTN
MDTDAGKLESAKRMGADEALPSGDEAIERIKDLTGSRALSRCWTWSASTRLCGWPLRWPGCSAT